MQIGYPALATFRGVVALHLHPGESAPEAMGRTREASGRVNLAAAALIAVFALTALASRHADAFIMSAAISGAWASRARRRFRRADDAHRGAHSERAAAEALQVLLAEGWRMFKSVGWRGHGDIDIVMLAPGRARDRLIVAVEVKTSSFDGRHLRCTARAARHVARGRPCAAVLATARRRETSLRDGVAVCDFERLPGVLRGLAREHDATQRQRSGRRRSASRTYGTGRRPGALAPRRA